MIRRSVQYFARIRDLHAKSGVAGPSYPYRGFHFSRLLSFSTIPSTQDDLKSLLEALRKNPQATTVVSKSPIPEQVNSSGSLAEDLTAGMFRRQIYMEEEQHSEAAGKYTETIANLAKMGRGTGLKHVQRLLLKWYQPFVEEIVAEMKLVAYNLKGGDRKNYGPILFLLPPEKFAVIALDATIGGALRTGNDQNVAKLAMSIGELVEAEVNLAKLKSSKDDLAPWMKDLGKKAMSRSVPTRNVLAQIRQVIEVEEWTKTTIVKVGACLLNLLIRAAKLDNGSPAFIHKTSFDPTSVKKFAVLRMDSKVFHLLTDREKDFFQPRYLPMLVPPVPWDVKRSSTGCYFRLKTKVMRAFNHHQIDALRFADMPVVLEALNFLGQTPWRINKPLLDVVQQCWERKIYVGELPSMENHPLPTMEHCTELRLQSIIKAKQKAAAYAAANAAAASTTESTASSSAPSESSNTPGTATAHPNPEAHEEFQQQRFYYHMCKKVEMKNAELHSLRCDMKLKLWVAEKFVHEKFYYPFNLDFRGRAYPVPPNLNHLGSDLCRSLLLFDEARPLGPRGLFALKVHLCNLFGKNKISKEKRAEWIDENMQSVRASAADPLDEDAKCRWWTEAEDPFQALAACKEIVAAIDSGCPETYMCRLPVHQDGSCNGLQHYAALGRDSLGAVAVNLTASPQPQDVYSEVLEIVKKKIAEDCLLPEDSPSEIDRVKGKCARMVQHVVERKVIKQTVMTSVYGVTKRGASLQIQNRLEERLGLDSTLPETERDLRQCSAYLAVLTLDSLSMMFTSARSIMEWLGTLATLVASQGQVMSWVTPLGLPVIQPYRKYGFHAVRTMLQTISLSVDDDSMPVSATKQRTAFPPNFVHSLDATHMLMTAHKMKEKGIVFTAVHDSYWTHPCDADQLAEVLRECFVELYEQPILESLVESLSIRFPEIEFPPIPDRGDFDLKNVLSSEYFFH